MRKYLVVPAVAFAAFLMANPAAAQRRTNERVRPVPDTGMVGVGGAMSIIVPTGSDLAVGWDVSASAERYLTPRLSLRGQLGGAWADITGHSFRGTSNPVTLDGNVVYNWEGGKWHPHFTAGAGLYRYRFLENNLFKADNKLGANLGGGTEYFLSRRDSLTGEILFHYVSGRAESHFTSYDPRFWSLAGGYKSTSSQQER